MSQWDSLIASAGQKYNVDPQLIASIVKTESSGNPNAYNAEYGARGLGQQIPATAKALGIDPKDPAQSIEGVAKLLNENLNRYGSPEQAVLAYHGGTDQANWGPKTQDYLRKVSANYGAPTVAKTSAAPAATPDAFEEMFGPRPTAAAQAPAAAAPDADPFEAMFGPRPSAAAPAAQAQAAPAQPSEQPGLIEDAAKGFMGYAKDAINPEIIGAGAVEGFNRGTDWMAEKLAQGLDASGLAGYLKSKGIDSGTYEEQVAANKARRAAYDATGNSDKLAGKIAQLGGEMAPTAGALGAAGNVLKAGGNAVLSGMRGTEALSGLAPAAQGFGNFVSGNGGLLSRTLNGGLQGAGAGALMSGGGGDVNENMALGAVLGGASVPVISGLQAVGSKIASAPIFNPVKRAAVSASDVAPKVEEVMTNFANAMAKEGTDIGQMPASTLLDIRTQVTDALRTGKTIDPAAIARKMEFESVGIKPTLGQITRDPTQFATERNMRGIQGAGEPLANRFNEQNSQLNTLIGNLGGKNAVEGDIAGSNLINRLQGLDKPKAAAVSEAYNAARDATGRYAPLDVPTFSQNANSALDEQMLGRFLPDQVKGLLNDVSSGKIPLNVNTAVQLDSVMSEAQRAAMRQGDKAVAKAVGVVRDSLNSAPIEEGAGQAAKAQFDAARKLAAQRFSEIDGAPALKAALDGASPDKFVQKYIISGDTPGVSALGKYMQNDPESLQVARQQIAGYLQSKGFGANSAGDNQFSQAAYNKALGSIGTSKLNAFFSPEEVAQFKSIGKVGAYINSQPAGSAVNNSNTAGALMNIMGNTLSGIGKLPGVNILRDSARTFSNEMAASKALGANMKPVPIAPGEYNSLLNLLAPVNATGSSGETKAGRKEK